jgi:hypothetical protein
MSAKIIGTGKPITRFSMLYINVLRNALKNNWSFMISLKYFSPTQGLPQMPNPTLKSLKAIVIPYNGKYMNKIMAVKPGSINR